MVARPFAAGDRGYGRIAGRVPPDGSRQSRDQLIADRSDYLDAAVDGEDGPGTQLAVEEGGFELADDVATVRESLQALSERDRQILFLRYFEDMTQTEIAGVIGASQIQVSRRLSRSLTSLRAAQGTVGPAAPTRNRRRRTGP